MLTQPRFLQYQQEGRVAFLVEHEESGVGLVHQIIFGDVLCGNDLAKMRDETGVADKAALLVGDNRIGDELEGAIGVVMLQACDGTVQLSGKILDYLTDVMVNAAFIEC